MYNPSMLIVGNSRPWNHVPSSISGIP